MENFHTPDGLNDRVLAEARRRSAAPERERRRRPVLRIAVCAACALALLLGGVSLRPAAPAAPDGGTGSALPETGSAPAAQTLVPTFGLIAYAADEIVRPNADGGLAFQDASGRSDEKNGNFTGCLFQITGENIDEVSLSIDRGGLYRSDTRTGLTDEEVRDLFDREARGELNCLVYGEGEDSPMNADILTALGGSFTERYDPEARYGFWVPPEEMVVMDPDVDPDMDLRAEAWANIDVFDGARLTVDVSFTDGSEQSKTYRLSTGRLKMVYEDDGSRTVLPEAAGPDDPFVYGICATPED